MIPKNLSPNGGVSIILCCFNSATRISETLRHIAQQKVPGVIPWEVLLINNGSTDNTTQIALSEWEHHNDVTASFKIVDQPMPGLTYARIKGVEEALYDYVIFCDDDNWLSQDYIINALSIITTDKTIGALGGQSILVSDFQPPDWFVKNQANFALGKQSMKEGDITNDRGWVWGAGAIYRKDALTNCFSTPNLLSDRTGNKLSSGGDVEICFKLVSLGYKIFYSNTLVLKHYMPQERFDLNKFWKLAFANGQGSVYLDCYQKRKRKQNIVSKLNIRWVVEWIAAHKVRMKLLKSYNWDKKMNKIDYQRNINEINGRLHELMKIKSQYDHLLKNEN